jgi:hypothetical protein
VDAALAAEVNGSIKRYKETALLQKQRRFFTGNA